MLNLLSFNLSFFNFQTKSMLECNVCNIVVNTTQGSTDIHKLNLS